MYFRLAGNDRLQGLELTISRGGPDFHRAIYSDASGGFTVNLSGGHGVCSMGLRRHLVPSKARVAAILAERSMRLLCGGHCTPARDLLNEFEGRGGNDPPHHKYR